MAVRNPNEIGTRQFARRRAGVDFPMWDGMRLDVDPGAIPPNAFRELWNVDFIGNDIHPRKGQLKVNQAVYLDTDACLSVGFDYQQQPHRLYLIAQGCPGVSPTVGRTIGWYDPDFAGTFQRMLYLDFLTANAVLGSYSGELFVGADQWVKRIARIEPQVGVEPITTVGARQDTTILTFVGYTVKALCEFDGKLFIAAENIATPAASVIYVWDGLTVKEDLTGIVCPTHMAVWRDKLAVGFPASENEIQLRSVGDAPGTYATVAPGAGTVATAQMVEHLGNLYIANGTDAVWKYDGTTLAPFRAPTNATNLLTVASLNGFLYYGWELSTNNHAIVGRWVEAAVFEDSHEDLTTTFSTVNRVIDLKVFKGRLVAALRVSASISRLAESPDLDTTGTWTEITSLTNLAYQMLPF